MALLFMDGFDHYDPSLYGSKKWDNIPTNTLWYSASGRRLGGMIQLRCPETTHLDKTLGVNADTIIVGFAVLFQYNIGQYTDKPFLSLWDGTTCHISLYRHYSGYISAYKGFGFTTTLLGTYEVSLSLNVWYYIELKTTIHDTAGELYLHVNEYPALTLTSIDTRNGANAYVNKIGLVGQYSGYNYVCFDDVYVCDATGVINNDFLGDSRIDTIRPNGAGYATNWTPSAGSNYQCVDDSAFDNGTDRVSETTVGDVDSYTLADLPVGIAGIKGIQTNVFANRTDSGVATKLQPFIRPVATNYNKTEITTTITYMDYNEVTELNPETGAAWTKAELDAMEIGVTLTENPLP